MSDPTKNPFEKLDLAKSIAEKALGMDKSFGALNIEALRHASHFDALKDFAVPKISIPDFVRPLKLATQEEMNQYQSASVLLRRLAESITQWRSQLPAQEEVQPAVRALLNGGVQIEVETLAQESFHGIRIEGKIQGSPCIVLAHQATVQLLCFIQPVQPPEHPRRPIGFIIHGEPPFEA